MQPVDIYQSKNLGTNALHYQALSITGKMAKLLGKEADSAFFIEKAQSLKSAINHYFWMPEEGYYAQYLYGRQNEIVSPRSETWESLYVFFLILLQRNSKFQSRKICLLFLLVLPSLSSNR